MRIGSVRGNDELEVSLVPLIDVVLTLIIFFVVTTTFQDRSALKIDLPEASGQVAETPKDPLVVVVDAEGRYFVGGSEVLRGDAEAVAEKARRCGVQANLQILPDMMHVFPVFAGEFPEADQGVDTIVRFIQSAWE